MLCHSRRTARRAFATLLAAFALIGTVSATPPDPFQQILDFLLGQGPDPGLDPNSDGTVDVADLVWLLNQDMPVAAAGIVITACEDPVPIGGSTPIHVDVVDAQGRIINPGTPGGLPESDIVFVTLNATGSGLFDGLFNFAILSISEPGGGKTSLISLVEATVTVTGVSPPLPDPTPVSVSFVPSGSISGTLLINDGSPRPPLMSERFTILAFEQSSGDNLRIGGLIDTAGNYTIPGLPPGVYEVNIGPLLDGSSRFQGECVTDITVTAGNDTDVDVTLQPWAGAGSVSGTFMGEGNVPLQNGTVLLFPADSTSCERLAGARGTFAQPSSYLLTVVPAGSYDVLAQGSDATMTRFFTNAFGDRITVADGQNLDFPLVLPELLSSSDPSPVDYARVTGNPVFRWTGPAGVSDVRYAIELFERCADESGAGPLWTATDIMGTEKIYDGPPLEPNRFHTWVLAGFAQGGRQIVAPPTDVDFIFIAE